MINYLICTYNGELGDHDYRTKATLTIGEKYKPLNDRTYWNSVGIKIKNDYGYIHFYNTDRFCTLEEWRDSKFKILGL